MAEYAVYHNGIEKTYHTVEVQPDMTDAQVEALVQQGLKHKIAYVRVEADGPLSAINQVRTEDLLGVELTTGSKGHDAPPPAAGAAAHRHDDVGIKPPGGEEVFDPLIGDFRPRDVPVGNIPPSHLSAAQRADRQVFGAPNQLFHSDKMPEYPEGGAMLAHIPMGTGNNVPRGNTPDENSVSTLPDGQQIIEPSLAGHVARLQQESGTQFKVPKPNAQDLAALREYLHTSQHRLTKTSHPGIGPKEDDAATQEAFDKLNLKKKDHGFGIGDDKKQSS